jgi:hypothetical protein
MTGLHDYIVEGRKLAQSRVYNGFTWEERIAVNAVQRQQRKLHNPMVCSISGYSRPDDPQGAGSGGMQQSDTIAAG